ncbi:phage portal protein [Treponema sp.]|uniref:phage portal protein n=1 Tax=Treponema sp. TaxID=166 RepID=UPI00388F8C75
MLTTSEIKTFIEQDAMSRKKQLAKEGMRYYEADHDIRQYRLFFVDSDGEVKEDKTRSNIKISHPFFTEIVDQATQYMLSGKDGFIRSDKPELQAELDAYFNDNEDFQAELYEVITGTQAKGFDYMYAFKGADGKTCFQAADSIGVVEVRAKETEDHCDYVIYSYVDRIGKNNKKINRIQVWDSVQTYFYCQEDNGIIVLDPSAEVNPRPHTMWKEDGSDATYYEGYGFIPFFRLDYCKKQFSALKPIKDLIDDYDLMSCGLSNNIQDANEVLYVVKGFQGDNLDELMTNIRTKKHIGVDDTGDVDIRTVNIPYQAREAKLALDEKNIYRFGMAFNSAQQGDGNITNIVIKSRYALLDLKCNKLEIRLQQFLRKLLQVVLKEINDDQGTDYQMKDVYFDFQREIMTNALDNAQIELIDAQKQQVLITTLLNCASLLDSATLIQNICDALDLDYNEIKDKIPDAKDEAIQALDILDRISNNRDDDLIG